MNFASRLSISRGRVAKGGKFPSDRKLAGIHHERSLEYKSQMLNKEVYFLETPNSDKNRKKIAIRKW